MLLNFDLPPSREWFMSCRFDFVAFGIWLCDAFFSHYLGYAPARSSWFRRILLPLRSEWVEWSQSMDCDAFTSCNIELIFLFWLFFWSGPQDIPYVYCLFYVTFVPLRWIYYRFKKWHYYLLVSVASFVVFSFPQLFSFPLKLQTAFYAIWNRALAETSDIFDSIVAGFG